MRRNADVIWRRYEQALRWQTDRQDRFTKVYIDIEESS